MSMVGELNKELKNLNDMHGIEISAIISRSGVPIAWNLPDESQIETFSTLSATILGASEVVYTGLGKDPPMRVIMESRSGLFLASSIGSKALIAAVTSSNDIEALTKVIQEAKEKIQEVLANEQTEF